MQVEVGTRTDAVGAPGHFHVESVAEFAEPFRIDLPSRNRFSWRNGLLLDRPNGAGAGPARTGRGAARPARAARVPLGLPRHERLARGHERIVRHRPATRRRERVPRFPVALLARVGTPGVRERTAHRDCRHHQHDRNGLEFLNQHRANHPFRKCDDRGRNEARDPLPLCHAKHGFDHDTRHRTGRTGDRRGQEHRAELDPAARKPLPEQFAPAFQKPLHLPFGAAELPGGLVPRAPVEAARDEHRPVAVWQPGEFLVEDRQSFAQAHFGRISPFRHAGGVFGRGAPAMVSSKVRRDPTGDSVEPRREAVADRGGLPCQREEHGLERVFRVLFAIEQPPTRRPHCPAVSRHERRERRRVTLARGTREQLPVRRFGRCRSGQRRAEIAEQVVHNPVSCGRRGDTCPLVAIRHAY